MPVHCKMQGGSWRIVGPDEQIEKTPQGQPRDGGGHPTEEDCQAQARAMNGMTTLDPVFVLRRWRLAEMDPAPNGKPCEIIYLGTFHLADRNRVLEVKREHLDQMVKNFHALDGPDRIAFNINHSSGASTLDEARAVGWLQDLFIQEHEGRVSLMGAPKWCEDARERLEAEQFKYLSAEIDFNATDFATGEKCGCRLAGVAICNCPAIPDLAPIELTVFADKDTKLEWSIARLERVVQGDSLMERVERLTRAFFQAFPDSNIESYYPVDVREYCLIIQVEVVEELLSSNHTTNLFQVNYQFAGKEITFTPRDQWIEVQSQYVPLTANKEEIKAGTGWETKRILREQGLKRSHSLGAAVRGTQQQEDRQMDELRKLLGISAEASIEEAIGALRAKAEQAEALIQERGVIEAQLATLTEKAKKAEAFQQEKAEAQTALFSKQGEVETLSTQVTAYKGEMEKLSTQVKGLLAAQHERETGDRIDLNLRRGRVSPAELEAQSGYLRKLADEQPEVFDSVMATRPDRPELFRELGSNTTAPNPSVEEIFTLRDQEIHEALKKGEMIEETAALRRVFAKRPDLEKLQYEGGK